MGQGDSSATTAIGVLGGFSVATGGRPVAGVATGSQRLLVYLALNDRTVSRAKVASALWPDVSAARAATTLRSALARLEPEVRAAVFAESAALALTDETTVDYREAQVLAHRLLDTDDRADMIDGDLAASAIAAFSRELLPDWFDEWIIAIGEEWRHLRCAALESLATRLLDAGRHPEAASAARAAITVDPLRETPHGILIRIHLDEGNQSNALGVYESYRMTLAIALDLEPTPRLTDLLDGIHLIGNESTRG